MSEVKSTFWSLGPNTCVKQLTIPAPGELVPYSGFQGHTYTTAHGHISVHTHTHTTTYTHACPLHTRAHTHAYAHTHARTHHTQRKLLEKNVL